MVSKGGQLDDVEACSATWYVVLFQRQGLPLIHKPVSSLAEGREFLEFKLI